MRLRWTTPAANDLYNIVQRIRKDNPAAATKVATILYDGCGGLRDFPRRGRKGRIEGTRELVFPGLPYIAVYKIQDQTVECCASTTVRKIGPEMVEVI
ncbi:MAG: type II toxin-antitoxin system RelE/ParE family toxin [Candidatus Sulfotelmatobacter sp.]|jgi:addiction module RelE/StbE family toxin